MDGDSTLLLIIFLFCLVFSAFFAAAESAFTCAGKVTIRARAENGDRRAKNALYVIEHYDEALTTALIGTNIGHIAAASLAAVIAVDAFRGVANITFYCTVVTTVIVFLFSEMIPKALANDRCVTLAVYSAGLLRFFMKLFSPLVRFFGAISSTVTKWCGGSESPSYTEEELYDIIDAIGEEGVVDEEQSDLLKSAMDFSDTTAGDVMTMRDDVLFLDVNAPREDVLEVIRRSNHSRIPVCDGSLDRVLGLLQVRWFLKTYLDRADEPVRRYLRKNLTKPYFVQKDARIDDLLETMRQHRIQMAFVEDGEHHTLGIVTIEDFLEELVGEIWDEDDVVDERFYSMGGDRYSADPELSLGEALRRMKRPVRGTALAPDGAKSLRAFVSARLGETPEEEDAFRVAEYEFSVEDTDAEDRLSRVVIRICPPEEPSDVTDEAHRREVEA